MKLQTSISTMFPGTKLSPDLLALVLALFELRPCRPESIGKGRVRSAIASPNTREEHRETIPEIACSQETEKYLDEKTMASRPPESE